MSKPPLKRKSYPTYKSFPFVGKVILFEEKNKIQLNAPQNYQHFVNTTCKVGDEISMVITNKRPKRSIFQNSYYHLYLNLISLSSGHTPEELHIWAKGKFLSKGIKEVFGEKVRMVSSTKDMTIGEFCEYLINIEEDTGIPCPNTEPFLKALSHKEYEALRVSQRIAYMRMKAKIVI